MCTCHPRPRTIKTRSGKWICAACLEPRVVPAVELREATLLREDLDTGTTAPANLSTFRHDLAGADDEAALLALVDEGEALTPVACYRLA